MKRNLVLLTSLYPFFDGEFFVDDEIIFASKYFENVYIICVTKQQQKCVLNKNLPLNVNAVLLQLKISKFYSLYKISTIHNTYILKELIYIIKNVPINQLIKAIQIMLGEIIEAHKIADYIRKDSKIKSLLNEESVFYSYWNDKRALALALLKQRYNKIKTISRAHGWDIDIYRHTPHYLPFKNFITRQLDHTYCISKNGLDILNKVTHNNYCYKTSVSYLGKDNSRTQNCSTNNNKFILVSCSSIIPLKRVHLIIDLISKLSLKKIEWYHFGNGSNMQYVETLAKDYLYDIKYMFMGSVSNSSILDFYASNYIDLFINVSEFEGVPVSIMEAQSAGIPVLATDVGGVSEIVNNENGFLVDKHFNVNETADMVKKYLLGNVESKLIKRNNAYQNWLKFYNATINYTNFYNDIIL